MGLYLITFFLLVVGIIGIAILIASRNREEDAYSDLETEEWDCPDCGFHVQAGTACIYCGAEKK